MVELNTIITKFSKVQHIQHRHLLVTNQYLQEKNIDKKKKWELEQLHQNNSMQQKRIIGLRHKSATFSMKFIKTRFKFLIPKKGNHKLKMWRSNFSLLLFVNCFIYLIVLFYLSIYIFKHDIMCLCLISRAILQNLLKHLYL